MSDKVNWDDFTPTGQATPSASKEVDWSQFDVAKPSGVIRRLADTGISLAKGIIGAPEALVGVADLVTGGRAGKLVESAGVRFKDAKGVLDELYSPEQKAANQEVQKAEGFVPTIGAMVKNPSTILNAAVESAPSMLVGGVASRGLMATLPYVAPKVAAKIAAAEAAPFVASQSAKAASAVAPIAAGAIGEGLTAAGQNAEQVRQEDPNGALTGEQSAILAASGLLTGGISLASGKLANKLGIGDAQTMLATGKLGPVGERAAKTAAEKGIVRKAGEGVVTEGFLQELPQSYQEQVGQNIAQGKPWDEGAAAAGAQGLLAGGFTGGLVGPLGSKESPPLPTPTPDANQPDKPLPLGFNPSAGTHTVFPDGSVVLNSDTPTGEQAVFDKRYAPQPIKPSEAMGLDPSAGPMSAVAVMAVDGGAHQTEIDKQNQALAQSTQAQSAIENIAPEIQLADIADPYEREHYLSFFDSADKNKGLAAIQANRYLETVLSNDNDIPDFDAASTMSDEDFLRFMGADEQEITNALAQSPTSTPTGNPSAFGNEANVAGDTGQGIGEVQSGQSGQDQVSGQPVDIPALPAASSGAGRADASPSMESGMGSGAEDVRAMGARSATDQQNGGVVSPANGAATGAVIEGQANVQEPPARTQAEPQTQAAGDEAPANAGTQPTQPPQGVSTAGSAGVEADGVARIDDAAHAAATSPLNNLPEPTQAQKKAGNYPKGHMTLNGLDLAIENPAGSVRRGKDRNGKAWENQIQHHYGYIKGTVGNDKDHVDLFVKPETPLDYSGPVFVVDQIHPDTGKFDEHKVIVGAKNAMEARQIYQSNYAKGWKGLKSITSMPFDEFKMWVKDGPKNKPLQPIATTPSTTQKDTAHEPQANQTQPQQTQQQEAPAGAVAGATSEVTGRPTNWRGNFLQAAKVARDLKLDPKGKKLAALVAEIEAHDAAQNTATTQSKRAEAAIEKIAEEKPSAVPESFISAPDGSDNFGEITQDMAKAMKRQAGKIRLQQGNDQFGMAHIEDRHGDQIRAAGFESVQTKSDEAGNVAMFSRSPKPNQTDTPAFKAWFGDSKVVDADGKPLVVYHGSKSRGIAQFKTAAVNTASTKRLGAHFTASPEFASTYGKSTTSAFLSIKNPLDITGMDAKDAIEALPVSSRLKQELRAAFRGTDYSQYGLLETAVREDLRGLLESAGHDGVRYTEGYADAFIVFEPEQIKSATGNNGNFEPTNPDIRFSHSAKTDLYADRGPSQEDIRKTDELFRAARPKKSTIQDVRKAVNQLVNGLGVLPNKLGRIVVATSEEIESDWVPLIGPVDIKSESEGDAQGFYSPKTRTVFLIADHINQGDEMGVVAHELMHKHGQDVLGKAGWDRLHGTIEGWKSAESASMERQVYDEAASRVKASGAHLSNQELFPYAVQVAIEMGVKPNAMARDGTAARWLASVRQALRQAWDKITNKPDQFKTQDMVNLAFGIAQIENPEHAPAMKSALDGDAFAGSNKSTQGTTADRAVMDMVREGRTAQDILQLIAGTSRSRFNKQVARLLLKTGVAPVVEMGGDLGGGGGFKFLAKYSPSEDVVTMTDGAQGQAEQIFMHEMVHAATIQALNRKGLASVQMRKLFEHVKKQGGAAGQYGMKNVREFASEAFTNPDFQRALKTMNAPSGSSFKTSWDGFVRILRGILGLSQDSTNALSQALDLGVAVMQEDKALRERGAVRRGDQARGAVAEDEDANFGEAVREKLEQRGEHTPGKTSRQYTPEQLAAMKSVGLSVETPSLKDRAQALWKDAGKKLAQGIADQFAPVRDLDKDAYTLLRLSKGASGAFEALLHGGQLKLTDNVYDFNEAKRGGVIDALLKPLQGEHHDFLRWVAANRAERLRGEGKENLFTPSDITALKSLADGQSAFDYTVKNGIRKGQVTRNRAEIYRDSLATFNGFQNNILDMAEQSGLIDGDARQLWEHEFYVPFYRVEDDGSVAGADIKSSAVRQMAFKSLTGRENKLNADLLDNTLMNWAHLLDASAKNRAAKATLEAAEKMGVAIHAPEATARDMARDAGNKSGVVWFRENGEKRFSFVDDPYVLTALTSLEYAGMRNPAMNAMSAFKHALTLGVTASPYFKIRNLIRDSVQVIASGPIGYNPVANVAQGWKLTDPKSDAYFRLLAGGGTIHFGTMMEGSEGRRVQSLVDSGVSQASILDSDEKVKAFYRKFIKPSITAYNELGDRGEAINRAALYDQLVKQGVSHAEASIQARDLMDFSMQGSFTSVRFLTQVVPFMNARIQGLYKLGKAAKEDPKRFAAVLGATAMFSLALLAAYSDDDDWKKREEWDRNNFWWFKFGGTAFRIPKPFEIGAIGTLAERGFELAFDKEMTNKRFMNQVMTLLGDNLSMNPVPQLVKPVIDMYANKDSFSGRPIETMGMEKLQPEYRFTNRTSMVARGVSTAANAVTGMVGVNAPSPVQVDHLLRSYFGWLGSFVVGAADVLARPATDQPGNAAPDYWKTATGSIASSLDGASSRYVSQMYDQAKEIEQAYGTWRALLKEGKTDEAQSFMEANKTEISKHKFIERVKKSAALLNQQIKHIERSDMPGDEKRAKIIRLREQQDRVARQVA